MSDGRLVSAFAAMIAASSAPTSRSPCSTCCTCQPYAAKRAPTSSLITSDSGPSRVTLLSSYSHSSLPSPRWPAMLAASQHTPSIMSPSLTSAYVW